MHGIASLISSVQARGVSYSPMTIILNGMRFYIERRLPNPIKVNAAVSQIQWLERCNFVAIRITELIVLNQNQLLHGTVAHATMSLETQEKTFRNCG